MSKKWYIVTNNENLKHFINFGLIIDKQGFSGDSYIVDAMEETPKGYIPCFSEENLSLALKKSIEEDSYLESCLLEVDFNKIAHALAWGGCIGGLDKVTDQLESPLEKIQNDEKINYILLPAPLPISIVKNIFLRNTEVKKNIQSAYELKFNSSSTRSIFKTRPRLFKKKENKIPSIEGIAESWQAQERLIDYKKVFSYGGALALLYYQTKNGVNSQRVFDFYRQEAIDNSTYADFGLGIFMSLEALELRANNVQVSSIFKELVNQLTPVQNHGVAKQLILNFLNNVSTNDVYTDKCKKLSIALENLNNRTTTKEPDTIFSTIIKDAYPEDGCFRDFALLVTLFFLRDKVETALKYHHVDFEEEHYVLVGIFYGRLFGIAEVPDKLRQIYDLSTWLSYMMAKFAHSLTGDLSGFKEPVRPLLMYGQAIKLGSTTKSKVHDFYNWINSTFNEQGNQSLLKFKVSFSTDIKIEGSSIVTDSLPTVNAKVDTDDLGKYIQNKIKEDKLFSFNAVIDEYKRCTK